MVLTDLKQREVEDLLITCVNGLKGFDTAINGVFPQATVQLCIVHQLRNSFRFIPDKYLKDFVKDIKTVYQTSTAEQGWENLLLVQEQWGNRYLLNATKSGSSALLILLANSAFEV